MIFPLDLMPGTKAIPVCVVTGGVAILLYRLLPVITQLLPLPLPVAEMLMPMLVKFAISLLMITLFRFSLFSVPEELMPHTGTPAGAVSVISFMITQFEIISKELPDV